MLGICVQIFSSLKVWCQLEARSPEFKTQEPPMNLL